MQLDVIVEETDDGASPENDIDDGSGLYTGTSGEGAAAGNPMTTRSRANGHEGVESEIVITASSPSSPECFQVWVYLYTMPNNTLLLPHHARIGEQHLPRLWLTRFVASGSTGNVWCCRFDNSKDLFAIKIAEVLHRSDAGSRQRLRNEFNVYLTLEEAHQSGRLRDRILLRAATGRSWVRSWIFSSLNYAMVF